MPIQKRKTAIFVLGMHRSGTSALTGVLGLLGASHGSEVTKPSPKENPKGFFENVAVQALNKKILADFGSKWDDYAFRIEDHKTSSLEKYIEQAKKILTDEFKYVSTFAIKDPRMSLLFPIWEKASLESDIDIRIVVPYRHPIEVAESLRKRNSFSLEKGILLWSNYMISILSYSKGYKTLYFNFDELLYETDRVLKDLSSFVTLPLTEMSSKKILEFLEPSLKHHNLSIQNFPEETPRFLKDLLEIIRDRDFENSEKLDIAKSDYYQSLKFFHHPELMEEVSKASLLREEVEKLNSEISVLQKEKKSLLEELETKTLEYKKVLQAAYKANEKAEARFKEREESRRTEKITG